LIPTCWPARFASLVTLIPNWLGCIPWFRDCHRRSSNQWGLSKLSSNPATRRSRMATSDWWSHHERNLLLWNKTPTSWHLNQLNGLSGGQMAGWFMPLGWQPNNFAGHVKKNTKSKCSELNQSAWAIPKGQIYHKYLSPLNVQVLRRNLTWGTPEKNAFFGGKLKFGILRPKIFLKAKGRISIAKNRQRLLAVGKFSNST
jgi:hypothetical protein